MDQVVESVKTSVSLSHPRASHETSSLGWPPSVSIVKMAPSVANASCEVVATDGFVLVTATFGRAASLTISFLGNGPGFVDYTGSLPGSGTRCPAGAPCTAFFEPGTPVVLTAAATAGFFSEWGGDCSGTPRNESCRITMFGNRSVTATFLADPVTAHVLGDQHIAIAANGVSCDQPCERLYERGTVVTFEAVPRPGKVFTGWGGDCAPFGNANCVLEMTGNKTVSTTVFVESYTLTVFFDVAGAGAVILTSPRGSFTCETSCTMLFTPGDTVTVEAFSLYPGSSFFNGFGGDCGDQGNPCTLTMNQDRSVTAFFFIDQPCGQCP